jgi:4-amino-4-deoxy-L-arabinose transferase-like glycosyltransferase
MVVRLSALVARAGGRLPRVVVALLALALALRIAFVLATPGYVPIHDDHDYDRLACALVTGEGYPRIGPPTPRGQCGHSAGPSAPTAYRPPGWPMVLAAVYTVSEPLGIDRWTAARVVEALIGTAGVALLGLIAWQLWGRRTAIAALALAAVFVPGIVLGGSLVSETFFVVLMLSAVAAALAYRRSGGRDRRWLIAAGVACGLALLTRSNAPAFVLIVAVAVATAGERPLRARLGRAAALIAVAALVVAPWTLRNAAALHGFVPVSTEIGATLAGTYNDVARNDPVRPGVWRPTTHIAEVNRLTARVPPGDEARQEHVLLAHSLAYMAAHPGYVAEVAGGNALRILGLTGTSWWRWSSHTVSLPPWTADVSGPAFLLFLALAVAGALTGAARRAPRWLWAIPIVTLLSVVVIIGEARLRAPIDAFVVLLGSTAVARVVPARRLRRVTR